LYCHNEFVEREKNLHFQLDEFVNKFEIEGPGVEQDMDKGQKLMEAYAQEFHEFEATRSEMGTFHFPLLFRLMKVTFEGFAEVALCLQTAAFIVITFRHFT